MTETGNQTALRELDERVRQLEQNIDTRMRFLEQSLPSLSTLTDMVKGVTVQLAELMQDKEESVNRTSGRNRHDHHRTGHAEYQRATRFTEIEFPRFQRSDVLVWLMKCERYFKLDETPEEMKVTIASFHLDDKAIKWHQAFERSWAGEVFSWNEFADAVKERFGPSYEAPMGELMKLRQPGSLAEFDDQFDSIICKLRLREEYVVQAYIAALSEDFAGPVRLFRPATLKDARRIARLTEFNMQRAAEVATTAKNGANASSGAGGALPTNQ